MAVAEGRKDFFVSHTGADRRWAEWVAWVLEKEMTPESQQQTAQQGGGGGQDSASQRTEFAAERTVLANERTYAAWMRTGLTALVSGLGALRFMKEVLPSWALLAVALGLLAFAAFSFAAGGWRYVHMGRCLAEAEIPQVKAWLVVCVTLLLFAAALIGIGSALLLS